MKLANKLKRVPRPSAIKFFRPVIMKTPANGQPCPRCLRCVAYLFDLGQDGRGFYCYTCLMALGLAIKLVIGEGAIDGKHR